MSEREQEVSEVDAVLKRETGSRKGDPFSFRITACVTHWIAWE